MVDEKFPETVIIAKEDSEAMLYVLEILDPLIKFYTKKAFFAEWEDVRQELVLAVIEAVCQISKCENGGQCFTYLSNAIKFRFVYLCKKNMKKEKVESIDQRLVDIAVYVDKYSDIELLYDLQKIDKL